MNIIQHDSNQPGSVPPVTCASWCIQGDGHPGEPFVEDQTCFGPEVRTITAKGEISAGLHRPVGGATEMLVSIEVRDADRPCAEMTMSIEYFREWLLSAEKVFEDVFGTDHGGTS